MDELFISQRINLIVGDAKLAWVRDCAQLQAELGASNNFGGSVGVKKAIVAATLRLHDAVRIALEEIAGGIDHRGGAWQRAHERLTSQLGETFSDTVEMAIAQMASSEMDEKGWRAQFYYEILRAKGEVAAHQIGWKAPAVPRWPLRHPFLFAIFVAVIGYVLGILSEPAKQKFFPAKPASQMCAK